MKWNTLSAAVLALGLNAGAIAGTFAPCTAHPVTIPCEKRGWHVLAEGLFIQPTNDDLEYFENVPVNSALRTRHAIQPKFRFGWRFEGGYHFGQGNDLTVNWMHFDRDYSDFARGATEEIDDSIFVFDQANAEARFDFDMVNGEFGQLFNLAENGDLRLHFGLQYLKLNTYLKASQEHYQSPNSGDEPALTVTQNHKYISKFHGVGTRVGLDWFYHLSHGFDIVSRAAGSLVVGDTEAEMLRSMIAVPPQEPPPGTAWQPFIAKHKRRTVIPTMQGRCGVRWSHMGANMNVAVEAGYHVMGVFQSVHFLGGNQNLMMLPPRPEQNISNFGNHGLYFNINVFAG